MEENCLSVLGKHVHAATTVCWIDFLFSYS